MENVVKIKLFLDYLKNLKLKEDKIKKIQENLIKNSVRYALENVEFYKKKWKYLKVGNLRDDPLSFFKKLPVVKGGELIPLYMQNIEKNLFAKRKPLYLHVSSGTSGKPFYIFVSERTQTIRFINFLRGLFVAGYKPWEKIVYVGQYPKFETKYNFLGMLRFTNVPLNMHINEIAAELSKMNDFVIVDKPSHLLALADSIGITRKNIKIRPKIIFSVEEKLIDDTKIVLEEAFKCKVFEQYAAAEFGTIAFECKKGNMHINADSLFLELLNEKNETNKDHIVITNFDEVFPFMRYEIGDVAKYADKCNCGINFPCIDKIERKKM